MGGHDTGKRRACPRFPCSVPGGKPEVLPIQRCSAKNQCNVPSVPLPHFAFLFSKSANCFIFSPETVDDRCGGVCHAGSQAVAAARLSALGLCLFSSLLPRHCSSSRGSKSWRTSTMWQSLLKVLLAERLKQAEATQAPSQRRLAFWVGPRFGNDRTRKTGDLESKVHASPARAGSSCGAGGPESADSSARGQAWDQR